VYAYKKPVDCKRCAGTRRLRATGSFIGALQPWFLSRMFSGGMCESLYLYVPTHSKLFFYWGAATMTLSSYACARDVRLLLPHVPTHSKLLFTGGASFGIYQ
jgi:hypothetical protein